MGLVLGDKEYYETDVVEWVMYDDDSIVDIIEDFQNEVYRLIDPNSGLNQMCRDELKIRIKNYRQDIFFGLLCRSIYYKFAESGSDENGGKTPAFSEYIEKDIVNLDDLKQILGCIFESFPDLLTAPASTRFHGNWEGGLMDHSISVYCAALKMKNAYTEKYNVLNPIFFLLHDVCKCGCYHLETKDVKNKETDRWETKTVYAKSNTTDSAQHGPESVMRIYELIFKHPLMGWIKDQFTDEWRLAIAYHMGMYSMSDSDMPEYNAAKVVHPEVLLMHHADMVASQLNGF